MSDAEMFPEIILGRVSPEIAEELIGVADPAKIDRAAVASILGGVGLFEAQRITDGTNPEGAFYAVPILDAVVIANRGVLTDAQIHEAFEGNPPEVLVGPAESGVQIPIIVPVSLLRSAMRELEEK